MQEENVQVIFSKLLSSWFGEAQHFVSVVEKLIKGEIEEVIS